MSKKDFPIFSHNPGLIYLDNAATTQKPQQVVDAVSHFLSHDYANIHRGQYALAERSEELFWSGRKKVAEWIGAREDEVVFSSSSTDSVNRLVWSLEQSKILTQGKKVLISEAEHHANIVPWQMAAERTGCEVVFLPTDETGKIDLEEFKKHYDTGVVVIACSLVSNVTGHRQDISPLRALIDDITYLVVDASQAVQHYQIDVKTLGADFLFFTGHKIGAHTGIGVLRGKHDHLRVLSPGVGGGASIETVTTEGYTLLSAPDKFEPGTPNLVGVVSLLAAIEYLEASGGYELHEKHEQYLTKLMADQFVRYENEGILRVVGGTEGERIGLFSFSIHDRDAPRALGQWMAEREICVRCGLQCAHPLHRSLGMGGGTCRVSTWIYNTEDDVERFFDALDRFLKNTYT